MKKRIFVIVVSVLLLLTSVSYAWMQELDKVPNVDKVAFDFGDETNNKNTIGVESHDFRVELAYSRDGYTYTPSEDDGETFLSIENWLPSEMIFFRLRFFNYSGATITFSVQLTEITDGTPNSVERPLLADVLFLSLLESKGYEGNFYMYEPTTFYTPLTDMMTRTDETVPYSVTLFNRLSIPPTGNKPAEDSTVEEDYIELVCYLYFDRMATIEYANQSLSIKQLLFSL